MSNTATTPDASAAATILSPRLRGPGWTRGIAPRLLLLLLIAEAPLVAFVFGLVLQNDRLQAAQSTARRQTAQHAALGQVTAAIRLAAAAASTCLTVVGGKDDQPQTCPRDAKVVPNSPIGADGPDQNQTGQPLYTLIPSAPGLRLVVQSGRATISVPVHLADTSARADPSIWLVQSGAATLLGGSSGITPPSVITGAGSLAATQAGHRFTYTSITLPSGLGPAGATLVAGTVRGQADAARQFALRLIELAALFVAEFILVAGGIGLVAARPLRRLNVAVEHWRTQGGFGYVIHQADPQEVRELAQCFAQAVTSLNAREAELRGSIAQQAVLMEEIHHRVKNNLQIIASLLNLQSSRIIAPEARAEFQSARDRVRALATLHRHLYAHGELQMVDMHAFFTELCSQLFQSLGEVEGDRIGMEVRAPDVSISSDQAVPIALVVTETVGNAVKYAFPDGRVGRISLVLELGQADAISLVVQDDGVGFTPLAPGAPAGGLGLQLVRGFARQLGAALTVSTTNGTCYRLDMTLKQQRPEARLGARAPDLARS